MVVILVNTDISLSRVYQNILGNTTLQLFNCEASFTFRSSWGWDILQEVSNIDGLGLLGYLMHALDLSIAALNCVAKPVLQYYFA